MNTCRSLALTCFMLALGAGSAAQAAWWPFQDEKPATKSAIGTTKKTTKRPMMQNVKTSKDAGMISNLANGTKNAISKTTNGTKRAITGTATGTKKLITHPTTLFKKKPAAPTNPTKVKRKKTAAADENPGFFKSLTQSSEPAPPPASIKEWMALKRLDP